MVFPAPLMPLHFLQETSTIHRICVVVSFVQFHSPVEHSKGAGLLCVQFTVVSPTLERLHRGRVVSVKGMGSCWAFRVTCQDRNAIRRGSEIL